MDPESLACPSHPAEPCSWLHPFQRCDFPQLSPELHHGYNQTRVRQGINNMRALGACVLGWRLSLSPGTDTHTSPSRAPFPCPCLSPGLGKHSGQAWKWKMDLPNSIMLFVCSGDTSALCQHHSPKHPRQSWKDPKTIPTSPGGREGSPALSCLQDPILLDSQQPWEHPEAFHTTLANVEINRKNKFLFSRFTFLGVKAAQSHKSGILMMFCVGWAALRAPEPLISTRREERERVCACLCSLSISIGVFLPPTLQEWPHLSPNVIRCSLFSANCSAV